LGSLDTKYIDIPILIIGKAKINKVNFIKISVITILPKNNIQKSINNPKNIEVIIVTMLGNSFLIIPPIIICINATIFIHRPIDKPVFSLNPIFTASQGPFPKLETAISDIPSPIIKSPTKKNTILSFKSVLSNFKVLSIKSSLIKYIYYIHYTLNAKFIKIYYNKM